MKLQLSQINRQGGTQQRASLNPLTVTAYATAMRNGDIFPAVITFYDGLTYHLADGFQRCAAVELNGWTGIEAEVIEGTLEDAQWYSYGANKDQDKNGDRRTQADIQKTVREALQHSKAATMSNYQIATHCGVVEGTVRNHRKAIYVNYVDAEEQLSILQPLEGTVPEAAPQQQITFGTSEGDLSLEPIVGNPPNTPTEDEPTPVREVIRNGTTFQMKVNKIGKGGWLEKRKSQIGDKTYKRIEQCSTLEEWAELALENRRRMETEDSPSFRLNMMDRLKMLLASSVAD